jgi:hypothetical protein
MATNASFKFIYAPTGSFLATEAIAARSPVIFDGADTAVKNAGAGSALAIGIALTEVSASDLAAGKTQITILLFGWPVEVTVGTGGATRGKALELVADGMADAPANGGGSTPHAIYGIAMQSGVATDRIGMMLCRFSQSSAT